MFYKRKQFLINRKFQLKFAFFVCSWIFVLSMVYPILIFNIFEYFLNMLTTGQQSPVHLSIEKIKALEGDILFLLGVLQLIFLGITFILSIFVSHRIAGPLFKLRKAMEEVSKGNYDDRITFRKNDHFVDMQEIYNVMAQNLSTRRSR